MGRAADDDGNHDAVAVALGPWVLMGAVAWWAWRPAPCDNFAMTPYRPDNLLGASSPAANPTRPPRDELHDEEQQRRSAERDEDHAGVTSERYPPALGVKDHAADEGANNTDDDVRHHARAATADQLGSEPAGDQADEKPDDYGFQRHDRD